MDEVWMRIENYLAANHPLILDGLAPGATEDDIAKFETAVGYRLPDDVRSSLKRHNGQLHEPNSWKPIGGILVPYGWELLSLRGMLGEWNEHRSIEEDLGPDNVLESGNPGVRPCTFLAARIPFAADSGGNSLCVDLDPDDGGTVGQIIDFDHEGDCAVRIADDYRSWLNAIADGFEAGLFPFNERLQLFEIPDGTRYTLGR